MTPLDQMTTDVLGRPWIIQVRLKGEERCPRTSHTVRLVIWDCKIMTRYRIPLSLTTSLWVVSGQLYRNYRTKLQKICKRSVLIVRNTSDPYIDMICLCQWSPLYRSIICIMMLTTPVGKWTTQLGMFVSPSDKYTLESEVRYSIDIF